MKYIVMVAILLCKLATAQSGYFIFSIVDAHGLPVSPQSVEITMQPNDAMQDIIYTDSNWVVTLSKKAVTEDITILVKSTSGEKKEMLLQLHYAQTFKDIKSPINIVCGSIPFKSGNYILDMPLQTSSWELVPTLFKTIYNKQISFKDITFLQNWQQP